MSSCAVVENHPDTPDGSVRGICIRPAGHGGSHDLVWYDSNAEDRYEGIVGPGRRKMPTDRQSITHKFTVGGYEGYITAGMYEDGTLGEIFLTGIGKEGSTLRGVLDAFAVMFSISLQYGAPLGMVARKLSHMKFEPLGATDNDEIPEANSIIDYIARWLAVRFGDDELLADLERMRRELK